MEMEQIIRLIQEVSNSNLSLFKYADGNISIELSKNKSHIDETYQLPGENNKANLPDKIYLTNEDEVNNKEDKNKEKGDANNFLIKSPIVGTFYSSSSEEGAPYIEVGDTVKKGQVIAIIEAMKIMNEIESTVDGVVSEILVKNQDIVEFGQPLVIIKPLT